ncbi:PREDICTED: probable protein phosphatase 2C 51 [Tarenaya hassleriana]|uniref:probable protein phosphatase 2C 51 n=1 Tax=Tarenaya hassleriana TaxID=28532 RepID=UPI00053C9E91|nr:PREDICTED: probable protein phosphatase 2C 51 [Tarenaya hassleriana]
MAVQFNLKLWILFCFVLLCSPLHCQASDPNLCEKIYKIGGSSALINSPECSYWKPLNDEASTTFCQTATLLGQQQQRQEDRALCSLDVYMPLSRKEEVKVGVTAVFDGFKGSQASDMASKMFLDMFSLHVQLLSQTDHSISGSEVLREAVVRAINDINTIFSADAQARNLHAGSTATISLMVDGKILVANVGNSKTFLCSKKTLPPSLESFLGRHAHKTFAKELTKDHSPDRDDEKARVEASGGYVLDSRVNGELPISRSIGAISYARNGVISTAEITDWRDLTAEDVYLVAGTSSVFEKMSLDEACEILSEEGASKSPGASMADLLVNTAFKKGSFDNLAAVVVALNNLSPARPEENDDVHVRMSRTDEL